MDTNLPRYPGPDFTVFKIDNLFDNTTTDFDLFIDLQSHFILYSGSGYQWERDELTNLLSRGHHDLYIRQADLRKASMYRVMAQLPQVEKDAAPPERLQSIEELGAKFTECLYQGEITESCVRKGELLASSMVDCIAEDPHSIKVLGQLVEHDRYTYYHSMRVAAFSVAIAIQMGLKDPVKLRDIALGGVFHDVGKKDVGHNILNKAGPLTEAEWNTMRSHPTVGFELIADTIFGHVPREIILHHHEKRNGKGYPHGLSHRDLLEEVQIATLADIFDALTSSRSYQAKRTRFEALDFIRHRLLKEEINTDAFKALVGCLAG